MAFMAPLASIVSKAKTFCQRAALWAFALSVLVAAFAGAASAQDTLAPRIEHTPVREASSGRSIEVSAEVTDDQRVRRVTLYVRNAGSRNYYPIPMLLKGASYRAEIPAALASVGTLEYYIEAVDASGNAATAPATNPVSSPFAISITSEPSDDFLRLPQRRGRDLLVEVDLSPRGGRVNPEGLRILVNGRDVTSEATFSDGRASLILRDQEDGARSGLRIVVLNPLGRVVSRSFTARELPYFDAALAVWPFEGPAFEFGAAGAWGPLRASVHLNSDDPFFTHEGGAPANRFLLALDTRLLNVQVGDVKASISPLTADGYEHRGYFAHLDLGPLETTLSSGYAAQEVTGESYARRFLGARQAIDFSLAELGVSAVHVVDLEAPGIPADPVQNYLFGVDLGAGLLGLRAEAEAAASLYFPNARGSFWEAVDEVEVPEEAEELKDLVDLLRSAPPGVRKYLSLPHLDAWSEGNPLVDAAVELRLSTPLPWSRLEARAFRSGPDFRSLTANVAADKEGFAATFATARLLNLIQFEAGVKSYRDNVQSLLSLAAGAPEPSELERNEYESAEGSLSLWLLGAEVNLSLERGWVNRHRSPAELSAGAPKGESGTFGTELRDLRFHLGPYAAELRMGLTRTHATDSADPANGKETSTSLFATKLSRGAFSYEAEYTSKREIDAGGYAVHAPSVVLGAGWRRSDVKLGPLPLHAIQIEGKSTFGLVKSDDAEKSSTGYRLRLLMETSERSQWGGQFLSTSTLDRRTEETTHKSEFTFGYLLRF